MKKKKNPESALEEMREELRNENEALYKLLNNIRNFEVKSVCNQSNTTNNLYKNSDEKIEKHTK